MQINLKIFCSTNGAKNRGRSILKSEVVNLEQTLNKNKFRQRVEAVCRKQKQQYGKK